jgi:ABC-type transport system involved in multi-copper enzyme maturation permease subunit
MLWRILAVAANTRREAVRNRAFIALVFLGLALVAIGWALSLLAVPSQKARVLLDFGYFAVSILGTLSGILMGVILLYKELERKTIFTLLPKPVWRFEIVLGKFLGLFQLIAGLIVFLGGTWLLMLFLQDALNVGGRPLLWEIFKALYLCAVEAMVLIAVALFFSAWSRPFLSGLFTVGYFLMGRTMFLVHENLSAKKGPLAEPGPIRDLANAATYVIPDLQTFNISKELVMGIDVPGGYLWAATAYGLAFTALFLVFGIVLFSRRDFV